MHNQTGCIAGMGLMPSGIDSLRYYLTVQRAIGVGWIRIKLDDKAAQ